MNRTNDNKIRLILLLNLLPFLQHIQILTRSPRGIIQPYSFYSIRNLIGLLLSTSLWRAFASFAARC